MLLVIAPAKIFTAENDSKVVVAWTATVSWPCEFSGELMTMPLVHAHYLSRN